METTKNELYLRTAFACMACDGDIAMEEIFKFDEAYKANYNITYPLLESDFDSIVASKLLENIYKNIDLTIYNNVD